jgi:hypothetical protein
LLLVPLVYLGGAAVILIHPSAIEYGEPFIVSASYQVSQGGGLYAPVEDMPFLHNNYNPLVQVMLAPVLAWTGPSYMPFRLLTIVSVLLLLLALRSVAFARTGSTVASALVLAIPLSGGFVFPWLAVGRVDAFALACAVVAFWRFVQRPVDQWKSLVPLWILCWMAFASKQTMLVVPVVIGLELLMRRRIALAFTFGLIYLAGCALLLLLFQTLSDGQYWLHAVTYNASHGRTPFWPTDLSFVDLLNAFGLPFVFGGLIVLIFRPKGLDRRVLLWFAISLPWALFLVRKDGSHVHYFFEAIVAGSLLIAEGWARIVRNLAPRHAKVASALLLALLMSTLPGVPLDRPGAWRTGAYFHAQQIKSYSQGGWFHESSVAAVKSQLQGKAHPSLLLAQTATLAVELGQPAIFDVGDFIRLQNMGRFDPEEKLLPMVRRRAFPVIGVQEFGDLVSEQKFGATAVRGLREAIEQNYEPLTRTLRASDQRVATFYVPRR